MKNILINFLNTFQFGLKTDPLGFFISTTIALCVIAIFLSVIINFINDRLEEKITTKEKRSVVETGTMTMFFVLYYLVVKFNIGTINIHIHNETIKISIIILGLIIIIIGTAFNIIGRFHLGKNWANQIKIYKNHSLITDGVFGLVRHPLYASLIWMFYAGSLVYKNWLAFILTSFIFVPFMYYRAKQEEELLSKKFPEYEKYKKKVRMFTPIPKKIQD